MWLRGQGEFKACMHACTSILENINKICSLCRGIRYGGRLGKRHQRREAVEE